MNKFEPFKICNCKVRYNDVTEIRFTLVLNSFEKECLDRIETSWSLGFRDVFVKMDTFQELKLTEIADFDIERTIQIMEFLEQYISEKFGKDLRKYISSHNKKSIFKSMFS